MFACTKVFVLFFCFCFVVVGMKSNHLIGQAYTAGSNGMQEATEDTKINNQLLKWYNNVYNFAA